jgi:hypothetical protein
LVLTIVNALRRQAANADAADTVTNQLASCCGLAEFNEPPAQPIAIKTSGTSACAFIVGEYRDDLARARVVCIDR